MTLSDSQLLILKKYPELPNPKRRLPYGYEVKSGDSSRIVPNKEVIFVLEDILDRMRDGLSLRDATDLLNSRTPKSFSLSHQGLKKVRARLRPGEIKNPEAKRRSPTPKYSKEEKEERRRKKEIADDKRRITHAQKRIQKAQIALGELKEDEPEVQKAVYELPIGSDFQQEIVIPTGIDEEEVIFKPSARQLKFLAAPEFQVLYGGAAGGGKSYALLADAARYIEYPSFNGVLIRRTLPELQELIWESHSLYPPLVHALTRGKSKPKWNQQDKLWTFPAGGHLLFSYCETEQDILKYQGQAYTWVGFDELTQHATPTAWNYLAGRVRTSDDAIRPFLSMRAATNPGGPGHGWVKKMFIDPAPYDTPFPARRLDPDEIMMVKDGDHRYPKERWGTPLFYRRFVPAKLSDNPYLGVEYLSNLESLPDGLRQQLLHGDWNVSEGAAFPEFRRSTHVVAPFDIPSSWRRFRSCDFGYSQRSASAVHWYAVDPNGTIYVYRELYVKMLTASQLSKKIAELEKGEDISYGMLDSSTWNQRGQSAPSIAEEMIHAGTRWRPSDRSPGARANGKNRLHELLAVDPYTDKPGLMFFDNCRHIISTLEVIPVDPDGEDDVDDKYVDDHSYDSLRYGVMSRPAPSSIFETFNKGVTKNRYRPADNMFGY